MRTLARSMRRALWAAPAAVLLLGTSACNDNRTTILDPVGGHSLDFAISPQSTGLPGGSVALGGGAATLTLRNLRALTGGNYQVWLVSRNAAGGDSVTAGYFTVVHTLNVGDTATTPDTVSATRTGVLAGSDDPDVLSMTLVVDSTADGSNPMAANAVVVTMESATATSPGAAAFLFRRIGVAGAGSLNFGHFGGSDPVNSVNSNDYVYVATATGIGGTREGELAVDITELARPPVGFYYRGFLLDTLGVTSTFVDTLRSAYSGVTSESRVSMFNADTDDLLPGVLTHGIKAAQIRNCATGSNTNNCQNSLNAPATGTFDGFGTFVLVLEPKMAGSAMGPAQMLVGEIPHEQS